MFEILTTPSFNAEKLVCGEEYDYVTRTSFNQGILRKTGFVNQDNINKEGTWSLGLLQMDFFYRKNPWYAGQFVRKIVPKISLDDNSIIFFTTLLNKQKQKLLNVLVRDVDRTFSNSYIQLPTKDGKIDFEFMDACIRELEEERIRELEEERIRELSAYLTVSGLDNYELSSEEKESLEKFNLEIDTWKLFKVQDVFDVKSSKKRFDANKVEILNYGFPYIVRMSTNNGIKGYINQDEQLLNQGNTIAFGQDTATMFYQENPYFTGDKIKILECKYDNFNKINSMFLISVMRKSFSTFSWGANSFSEKVINNQEIKLPTKDGKIDFEFMELLISAVQKLVIKDVVLYADEKIQSTKKIVKES